SIGVVRAARADALGDDGRARVGADVNHLGAGVGLLAVVGQRDRVEFADAAVALEDAARIFPGDRAAGLDLGPADLRAIARAERPLRDEIENPAPAFLVARIPVLDRRVFHL